MKKITIVLIVLVLIIIGLGIYKFNFTNDDIYNEKGEKVDLVTDEEILSDKTTSEPERIVVKDFEGEADSAKMTLGMKTWNWVNTKYSDDKVVKPLVVNKFAITFNKDNTFSATTDCNNMGGGYIIKGNKITFDDKMFSTKMYCENSQEDDFTKMLIQTEGFLFTSKGELVLTMKLDTGSIFFR